MSSTPSPERLTVVVHRASSTEWTYAIVSCRCTEKVRRIKDIRPAIDRALTHWMRYTDASRKAWRAASADYNVGDLSNEPIEGDLARILKDHGIEDLQIETVVNDYGSDTNWTYDTILGGPEG